MRPVLACPELDHLVITQGKKDGIEKRFATVTQRIKSLVIAHVEQLYDFISDLSSTYHDGNPYHNFAHAVDVLQCSYYILRQLRVIPFDSRKPSSVERKPQDLIRPIDVLALFIAAIGHDAAHPGVNNLFLVRLTNAFLVTLVSVLY